MVLKVSITDLERMSNFDIAKKYSMEDRRVIFNTLFQLIEENKSEGNLKEANRLQAIYTKMLWTPFDVYYKPEIELVD